MRFFLLIWFWLFAVTAAAQTAVDSSAAADIAVRPGTLIRLRVDSLRRIDSLLTDSLSSVRPPKRDTLRPGLQFSFASDSFLYRRRLFFSFTDPVRYNISERQPEYKETVFYTVLALLLLFAILKNAFTRYLSDLYNSYFRMTVRQKQIKEQLLQSPLPSLSFNIFFVLSTAVFIALALRRYGYGSDVYFLILVLYGAIGLSLVYLAKYLLLKFLGWVFQASNTAGAYLFVIYSTNKILGVFLLPFTVLLAFGYGAVGTVSLTLGILIIVGLFAYRFFLAFLSVGVDVRINAFHFLLYLAAFEVLPLLLINKLLFAFLREIT